MQSARQVLTEHVVPLHFGFDHIDHETIIKDQTTILAITLFGNNEKD